MTGAAPGTTRFDEAWALHQSGAHAAAERLYREILAADPAHFEALLHLGIALLQAGDAAAAGATLARAVTARPDSAVAQSTLATALHAQQQYDGAIERYDQALTLDPDHAESHYGLATSLAALGRAEEAIACYGRALILDPDYAEAALGLGVALQGMQRHVEAVPQFEAALAIDPDFAEARYGLGVSLQALGRHARAFECFSAVAAADPAHRASLVRRAEALQSLQRHDEAIAAYERVLDGGTDAATLLRYGVVLREAGRIEAAHRAFERAVALDPRNPEAYLMLFSSKPLAAGDPHLAAAATLAGEMDALGDGDRMNLHFALGKGAAALGEHDKSFGHFIAGNALKRAALDYDEAARLDLLARIARMFDANFLAARKTAGHPSPRPIFIVGMPRSGSTLIEQILASHPQVAGGGERPDFGEAIIELGADSGDAPFPQSIPALEPAAIRRLGETYLAKIAAAAHGADAARITDKLLENFMMAGLIHFALPNAKIVHARRDPVDTCLSCFTTVFADVPYASDLGELARYYRAYAGLMRHWRHVLPPGVMLEVDYEAVVADLEPEARRLLAHCGLDWHPACLEFHRTERPVRTASAAQVRQPLYKSSVGRWRPDEPKLRPLLDALGPLAG